MMTAAELIRRYNITLAGNGQVAVPGGKRLPAAVIAELKARKAEILAELERQKAEAEAKAAAEKARLEAEVAALRAGEAKIVVHWRDGDPLSGYTVYDLATLTVLREARIGREVMGWGYLLPDELVQALGTEFTLADAVAWAEAQRRPQVNLDDIRREKLAEAARTGQSVEVRRWTEPCNDGRRECSLDVVIEWALPDGTTRIERHHTH